MREKASGWVRTTLREVATKVVDGSHNPPPAVDSGKPMLSARNVENGRIVWDHFRFISDADFDREHSRTRVSEGDVLLTIVGSIGRTAVVSATDRPFTLQRSVAVISVRGIEPRFLSLQGLGRQSSANLRRDQWRTAMQVPPSLRRVALSRFTMTRLIWVAPSTLRPWLLRQTYRWEFP